jgi:hypothetical protein
MYADTIENVVIGASSGSGGKDLLIVGCGRKVTALDLTCPSSTSSARRAGATAPRE